MNNGTINETEVRKWFDIMRAGNELTEVRIIADKMTYSGYFNNAEDIISAIKPYVNYNIGDNIANCVDLLRGVKMGTNSDINSNLTRSTNMVGFTFKHA